MLKENIEVESSAERFYPFIGHTYIIIFSVLCVNTRRHDIECEDGCVEVKQWESAIWISLCLTVGRVKTKGKRRVSVTRAGEVRETEVIGRDGQVNEGRLSGRER